ncbi:CASP7 [Mytilus edulis]|uniref:CASP7 n=1 Tax=Mytilus edulis TaxID=6550 RepID=A0A8S3QLN3_MYTED|nr:CASP7 [Mytilus edulis]
MEGCYNFNQKERGIALLIHNEYFLQSSGYQDRRGDDRDYRRMKKIFKRMGFKVCSFRDQTAKEMLRIADEVAGMEKEHRESDCFVCVVASHGVEAQKDTRVHSLSHDREHMIVGVDGKEMSTSDFVEKFDGENCEGLQGKPKFFFIQACRIGRYRGSSEGMDKGLEVGITTEENMEKKKKKKTKGKHMVDGSVQERATSEKQDSEDETVDESDDSDEDEEDIETSDTDDDEDFAELRAKLQKVDADLSKESHPKQRLESEKRIQRKNREEVDAKGIMPDEDSVNVSVGSSFSKIDVPVNAKTNQQIVSLDKTKPSAHKDELDDKKLVRKKDSKLHTEEVDTKGYKPSTRRVDYVVPMVTVVPCPEDTLIMFASTSGNFAVRSPAAGSWLLNKLYQQLKVHTKDLEKFQKIDFLNILTEILTCMSLETYSPGEKSNTKI